jgi:hypothetical protein
MNNVSVDYNSSNIPGFFVANENNPKKPGKPVAIRLSIGFSEIEYMLANDWGEPATPKDKGNIAFLGRIVERSLENINPFLNGFTANTGAWSV